MAIARLPCALICSISDCVPCTVSRSLELPATTEGRLLRGSLSLGTQGRNLGPWFYF